MEEGADIEYSQIFYKRHSVEQFLDSSHTATCHLSCISGRVYRFSTPPVTPRHSRSAQLAREFPLPPYFKSFPGILSIPGSFKFLSFKISPSTSCSVGLSIYGCAVANGGPLFSSFPLSGVVGFSSYLFLSF